MNMAVVDPLQALVQLQRSLASTKRRGRVGLEPASSLAFPPINFFVRDDDYVLVAELPGVDKNSLDIQVRNNQVRIAGNKPVSYDEKFSIHRRERRGGQFNRTFDLPVEVDSAKVTAAYEDGMLIVQLPRAEHDKPRTVPVD